MVGRAALRDPSLSLFGRLQGAAFQVWALGLRAGISV